jgi:hypothetical protein
VTDTENDSPEASGPDPRLNVYRPDLADAGLRGIVQAKRFVAGKPGRVIVGRTSLKEAPDAGARQGSELLFGDRVTVFEHDRGWAWLRCETDGYVGYARSDALARAGRPTTHRITALRSYLFGEPDLKSPPRDILHMTSAVAVVGRQDNWLKLSADDGMAGGWIWGAHAIRKTEFGRDAISAARRFIGAPYAWGGRSTEGLDCSALVQLALAHCGVACARDSDMQESTIGVAVEVGPESGVEAAEPGDLLFWPGHVAFLVGGGRILHANAHHMAVAEERLSEFRARTVETIGEVRTIRRPILADDGKHKRRKR